MAPRISKIPLFIKVPVILAILLTFVLIFTIVFENVPEEKEKLLQCKVTKEGELKGSEKPGSMVTHVFRNAEGSFLAGTLNAQKDTWTVSKLLFAPDFTPYLESISSKENYLAAIGDTDYELAGSFEDWALIRTKQGRLFSLQIKDGKISPKSSLGLCGASWEDEAKVARLNNRVSVIWDSKGRLGFYDLTRIPELVPREVPRSPDTYMGVETGNVLNVEQCGAPFSNTKASVRIGSGVLAYSSGESRNISVYEVGTEQLSLTPLNLDFKLEQFSDFFVTPNSYIGFKTSNWLDRNERWNLRPLHQDTAVKEVGIGSPLGVQRDYTAFDEKPAASFWIAEKWKKWQFANRYILTHVNIDGTKKNFELEDGVAQKALTEKGLWRILPGHRHLFISNKADSASKYSLVECPL
ncbi:hypothetical protein [Bdellovibrio bacteriovorus]|uniref:hypothetical protein n=1 Tax=Bdellovibrio TaxID=958 RepID=UPI0035A8CE32